MDVSYSSASTDRAAQLRVLRTRLDADLFGLDIVAHDTSAPVEATFRPITVGDLRIARYSGTPVTAYRTRRQISRTPRDDYLVALQLSGSALLAQRGRRVELRPGDLTVIDGGEPYALRLAGAGSYELMTIRVPRTRFDSTLDISAIRLAADSGPGRLLAPYFRTLSEPDWACSGLTGRFLDTGFDLLTTALSETPAAAADPVQSALRVARRHLGDPGLSVPKLAAATHISVRHLYRLLAEQGISFGQWLHDERLRHCHRDLTDPAMTGTPIAEIGARWGYRDRAHFSRLFRRRYGVSPRTVRQQAVRGT